MPLSISAEATIEKNKLDSGMWFLLLKIAYPLEDPGYVCLNNDSVDWNGNQYKPAAFQYSGFNESKSGEVPDITLIIADPLRTLIPFLELYGGGAGAIVTIYTVLDLSNPVPELEEETDAEETRHRGDGGRDCIEH